MLEVGVLTSLLNVFFCVSVSYYGLFLKHSACHFGGNRSSSWPLHYLFAKPVNQRHL